MLGKVGFKGRLIVVSGFGPDYLQTLGSLAGALAIRVAGVLEKPIRPIDLERSLRGCSSRGDGGVHGIAELLDDLAAVAPVGVEGRRDTYMVSPPPGPGPAHPTGHKA